MAEQTNKKFFGTREVIGVEDTGLTTPLGNKIIKAIYADGTTESMPEKVYNLAVSEVEVDATNMRELIIKPLAGEILALMAEYDLKLDDLEPVIQLVTISLNDNLRRADNKLWAVAESGHRRMLQIDSILKS